MPYGLLGVRHLLDTRGVTCNNSNMISRGEVFTHVDSRPSRFARLSQRTGQLLLPALLISGCYGSHPSAAPKPSNTSIVSLPAEPVPLPPYDYKCVTTGQIIPTDEKFVGHETRNFSYRTVNPVPSHHVYVLEEVIEGSSQQFHWQPAGSVMQNTGLAVPYAVSAVYVDFDQYPVTTADPDTLVQELLGADTQTPTGVASALATDCGKLRIGL